MKKFKQVIKNQAQNQRIVDSKLRSTPYVYALETNEMDLVCFANKEVFKDFTDLCFKEGVEEDYRFRINSNILDFITDILEDEILPSSVYDHVIDLIIRHNFKTITNRDIEMVKRLIADLYKQDESVALSEVNYTIDTFIKAHAIQIF